MIQNLKPYSKTNLKYFQQMHEEEVLNLATTNNNFKGENDGQRDPDPDQRQESTLSDPRKM